jgi:hypothetical protein
MVNNRSPDMHTYIYTQTYIHMHTYIYITHTHAHTHTNIYPHFYIYTHIYTHIYIYIYIYLHTHTHTHTHTYNYINKFKNTYLHTGPPTYWVMRDNTTNKLIEIKKFKHIMLSASAVIYPPKPSHLPL